MSRAGAAILLSLVCVLAPGCASHWETSYRPDVVGARPPTERVVIREVPWERLGPALEELDVARAASATHPDEWTMVQRAERTATLAGALQLSEDPARLEILGRSDFLATADVPVLDGTLSAFARSLGAHYAIWSAAYKDRAQTVEHETVRRTGMGWSRHRRRDGRIDYDYVPYNETLTVPVVIERDRFRWVVFYVRVND